MGVIRILVLPILLLTMVALFWKTSAPLPKRPSGVSSEMQVVIPWFVQVLMAGGDRYLASDVNVIRALIVSTDKMDEDNYKVLAQVQKDAAFLNPRHEDNYYIAAAILPWNDQFEVSQEILAAATVTRTFDPLPPFYYGFGLYYFDKQPSVGAQWLLEAAKRDKDVQNQYAYENLAARWFEKGNEPSVAINIVEAMARNSRDPAFRKYLQMRVDRLKTLERLTQAAQRYKFEHGSFPLALTDLVSAGYIDAVPVDPFGFGYVLGTDGMPRLLNARQRAGTQ